MQDFSESAVAATIATLDRVRRGNPGWSRLIDNIDSDQAEVRAASIIRVILDSEFRDVHAVMGAGCRLVVIAPR